MLLVCWIKVNLLALVQYDRKQYTILTILLPIANILRNWVLKNYGMVGYDLVVSARRNILFLSGFTIRLKGILLSKLTGILVFHGLFFSVTKSLWCLTWLILSQALSLKIKWHSEGICNHYVFQLRRNHLPTWTASLFCGNWEITFIFI